MSRGRIRAAPLQRGSLDRQEGIVSALDVRVAHEGARGVPAREAGDVPWTERHACVSPRLDSGVSAPEVSARAGHSVDVLLKSCAKCIDGRQQEMNDRTKQGLGEELWEDDGSEG